MTTRSILASALLLASVATPAFAEPAPIPAPNPTMRPAQVDAAAAVTSPDRFCIKETLTGTRIQRQMCRTRQEWSRQGVDVDARR